MSTLTNIKDMKNPSIVLYGPKDARLEDKPIPELSDPNHVLVRIAYVGVCGSDVHFYTHASLGRSLPPTGLTVGHEASGTTLSPHPTLPVGTRIAIEPSLPCRLCPYCKRGTYHLCRAMRFAASPGPPATPGTLAKYFEVAADMCYPIPDWMGLDEAVCVEPAAVGVHAVKLADVRPGETVVVLGSGTVGVMCGAVAREFGAGRVIMVDVREGKVEFAKKWVGCEGWVADTTVSGEENAGRFLAEFGLEENGTDTSGGKVDCVIEASGAGSSVEMGIHLLRPGGKFVQTGLGREKVEFPIVAMSQKELMVRGCFRYGPGDYELALKFMEKKRIDVKPLISSVSKFEDATKAWEKTAKGEGIKNLIEGVQD